MTETLNSAREGFTSARTLMTYSVTMRMERTTALLSWRRRTSPTRVMAMIPRECAKGLRSRRRLHPLPLLRQPRLGGVREGTGWRCQRQKFFRQHLCRNGWDSQYSRPPHDGCSDYVRYAGRRMQEHGRCACEQGPASCGFDS